MSGDNPRLILEGRKTQTRRLMNPQPSMSVSGTKRIHGQFKAALGELAVAAIKQELPKRCPYGVAGDRLWVREKWCIRHTLTPAAYYFSTEPNACEKWKPSIHMPRWASRITLEILKVRTERLNEIRCADVVAEGFPFHSDFDQYKILWDLLHGKGAWDENPWVWVIEFRKVAAVHE